MKKRRQALQGYKKKGSTFYPPFLTKMEDAGMTFNSIDWRSNMLPELFWLAPLVREFGILKSCMLIWTLSNAAREAGNWDVLPSIGAVSSFADLTPTQKSQVRRRMQAAGVLGDLRKSIDPLVRLYPKFPLKFLLGREKPAVKKSEAMQYLAPLLFECLFRYEKLPMQVQGVAYAVGARMGKYVFNKGMNPPLPQDLEDYPESDKSQRAAASIRAIIGNLDVLKKSCSWPEYFWQRGNELGKCRVPHDRTAPLWAHTQEYILYQSECFYRYSEESQEIWHAIEKKRKFDLYSPLREEILFGLATRIYRLTVQILSFAPNWVEDIGQVYVRMAVESYLYWKWLKDKGQQSDFESFYEHGLGQQKLFAEHISNYLKDQGLSTEQIEDGNPGLDFLKRHKLQEFVSVNVGNPLKKDLRKIAEEVDEREIYVLVYGPTSSMVHGMYDTLDMYYLRQCVNPFHKLHRVPFYWTKSPLSAFGPVNVMTIMDWVFGEIVNDIGLSKPASMPGESYIARFFDEKQYKQFCERDDIRMEAAEDQEFVDQLNKNFRSGERERD